MKKGDQRPVKFDDVLYRTKDVLTIFDGEVVNNTVPRESDPVECGAFRHFTLFLNIDSTSTPTDLHIEVQFLDAQTGKWHTYKQGPFASLYYEDTDVASGILEVFSGRCAGRAFRVKLTGSGTTSSAYFTVSVSIEFWN